MRRAALLTTVLLLAPFSGDAFAKKKKKRADAPAAETPAEPVAAPADAPTPKGLTLPDWVARTPESGVTVKLLDAGQGEAAPLRLSLSQGTETVLSMAMDMEMTMSMGGMALPSMPLPTQVMIMDIVVDEVDADGNTTYTAVVSALRLENTEDIDPSMVTALDEALRGIVGLKTTATVDDHSRTIGGSIEGGENLSPDLQQQMQNLSGQLEGMSLPFPEEPVAPGAKWEVLKRTTTNGMSVAERHLVTLASRDGDRVELETSIEQALAEVDFTPAGLPPGTAVDMQRFASSGSGRTVQDLGHPVPVEGRASIELDMEMVVSEASFGQMPFSMNMKMTARTAEGDPAAQ